MSFPNENFLVVGEVMKAKRCVVVNGGGVAHVFFFCGIWMTGSIRSGSERKGGEKSLLIVTVVWKRQTTRVVTPVFLIGIATVSFL